MSKKEKINSDNSQNKEKNKKKNPNAKGNKSKASYREEKAETGNHGHKANNVSSGKGRDGSMTGKGKPSSDRSDHRHDRGKASAQARHGIERIEWSQEERERTQTVPVMKHMPHNNHTEESQERGAAVHTGGQEYSRQYGRNGRHAQNAADNKSGHRSRKRYGNKYGIRTGHYLGYQEDERSSGKSVGEYSADTVNEIEHDFLRENTIHDTGSSYDAVDADYADYAQADSKSGLSGSRNGETEQAADITSGYPGTEYQDTELDTDAASRIEGRNAVAEAFRAGRTIDRLYVLDGCEDGPVLTIKNLAARAGTPIRYVSRQRLDQMSVTGAHQGVIASVAAYHYGTIDDLFRRAEERKEDPFFIILDNIEDPHNLGAIIRTANVAGAHGVIIAKDRAVGLTATVAKASAGAINYTPVVKVTNISQTIEELKKKGLWFVCADMDGQPMTKLNLAGPIGLVIGAEGVGVSRLGKEKCDIVASIPQHGEINSLNASVAAGILAYEILRQRG